MGRYLCEISQKDGFLINPPPPLNSFNYEKQPTSSFNRIRISPVILLVIIILAVIFFVSGFLHLLVRLLLKRPHFSAIYHSNRFLDTSTSHSLQRQLQQLFRQHDSGLDQAFVDALPLFHYNDIIGSKEPFDCAVCLCEFTDNDRLRLLPNCSHAFHIDCIDTWLLSNSTCPLCRGTLLSSAENPVANLGSLGEISNGFSVSNDGDNGSSNAPKPEESNTGEKKVFSVRLGKFRSLCEGESSIETRQGESSRCNMDARRCYSMGAVEYVVGDSNLQVQFSNVSVNDEGVEGKQIKGRSRGDSFSVSKTWLWSKNNRFQSNSSIHLMDVSSLSVN